MKTNRKTRPQPSLAALSAEEYHQLADMVRTRTYDDILQQIVKPRVEGGFDLDISIKPLQVLHRRVTEFDRVNKLIADGQKLTLTAYDELQAGQTPPTGQIHNAILNATWLQIQHNENTPHQLLALQRLADFPARAEIRENREQIYQEKHTNKIEMDTFRKEHATERLEIQKRHLQIAEKRAEKELSTQNSTLARGGDHLGPFARNWDDVSERARIHFGVSKEEWARRTGADEEQTQVEDINSQGAVIASNPTSRDALDYADVAPADQNARIESSEIHASGLRLFGPTASTPTTTAQADLTSTTLDPVNPLHPVQIPSALKSDSASPSETQNSKLKTQNSADSSFVDLAAAVNRYTLRRAEEYVAHERNITPWLHRTPPPKFITQHRHCPCGNACPCPHHETPEKGGPFPEEFWSVSPFGFAYSNQLFARDLPYRVPTEYLA